CSFGRGGLRPLPASPRCAPDRAAPIAGCLGNCGIRRTSSCLPSTPPLERALCPCCASLRTGDPAVRLRERPTGTRNLPVHGDRSDAEDDNRRPVVSVPARGTENRVAVVDPVRDLGNGGEGPARSSSLSAVS